MLSPFDDHPVHQLAAPVLQLASGDRNAFERYTFHGARVDGTLLFSCTLALYPNREIVDAALSIVLDGVQHSVHASARSHPGERATSVGPFSIEVAQPLQVLRVALDGPLADELGVHAALTFTGHGTPVERARHAAAGPGGRDTAGFRQWGAWDGSLELDGTALPIDAAATIGSRERSWGVEPVGEPVGGAPLLQLPQRFAATTSARFGSQLVHAELTEDADGRRSHVAAHRTTVAADGAADGPATVEPLRDVELRLDWQAGTRRPAAAVATLIPWNDDPVEVALTPLASMALRGLGSLSPDWMHGSFKAEQAVGRERWVVAELDAQDVHNLHWFSLCRARSGDREGIGTLEVLPIGPHAPSGLTGFTDGAP